MRPVIAVSNDDGYLSPGINVLADALEELGEVWVVAPERARSAAGHAITLHKPLRLKSYGERRYWCSGTPTDAVNLAVNHLLPRPPALLVSGINIGPNLGDDATYSGTIAAAMEGALHGVPSLAVSLASYRGEGLEVAAQLALRVGGEILRHGLPPRRLLNLNVPPSYDIERGIRITSLGIRNYNKDIVVGRDPRGRKYYWIGGSEVTSPELPGSDTDAHRDGFASLSPITLELTAEELLGSLREWKL